MHPILGLVPVTAYILVALIFVRKIDARNISDALVKSHLVIFAFIAVSTECLSLFQAISYSSLLKAWSLFLVISFTAALALVPRRIKNFSLPLTGSSSRQKTTLAGAIAIILIFTFMTAILYPPNTYDSMTYHMSRVMHWISNNSVSFYPTPNMRQNYQMPLAEFAILHMQVITGFDFYANLVQWVSFLILISLSVLIAAELGLTGRQQLISAFIMATLPMAILQGSSTQNDLVVSSFVMAFALYMLRIQTNFSFENFFFAAIALGLALLTKGTGYLYTAAIGISMAIPVLLKNRLDRVNLLKSVAALSLVVIAALSLNAGHLLRNYRTYGHPLSTEEAVYKNQDMSVAALLGNITRNCALHLGTPSQRLNRFMEKGIRLALGSQFNNPETTFKGTSFSIPISRHEDTAGNLFHMVISLLSVIVLTILWWQAPHNRAVWYAIGTVLGAIFYCWLLRWQPWASRLHTPIFALAAPLLAIAITAELGPLWKRLCHLLLILMALYSLIFVFC